MRNNAVVTNGEFGWSNDGNYNLPMTVSPSCFVATPSEHDLPKSAAFVLHCPAKGGPAWFRFVGNKSVAMKLNINLVQICFRRWKFRVNCMIIEALMSHHYNMTRGKFVNLPR